MKRQGTENRSEDTPQATAYKQQKDGKDRRGYKTKNSIWNPKFWHLKEEKLMNTIYIWGDLAL